MEYRDYLRERMNVRIHEHVAPRFDCSACDKGSEIEGRLCLRCERRLTELARTVDPTLEWLEQMAAVEALSPLRSGEDRRGRQNQGANIAPASLAADQLVRAVGKWVEYAKSGMAYAPKWRGKIGQQLTALVPYIAGLEWAGLLIDDLVAELRAIRREWPHPNDEPRAESPLPAPCLQCGKKSVWLHPIAYKYQPLVLACEYRDPESGKFCGWRSRDDGQDLMAKLTLLEKERQRLAKLAAKAFVARFYRVCGDA